MIFRKKISKVKHWLYIQQEFIKPFTELRKEIFLNPGEKKIREINKSIEKIAEEIDAIIGFVKHDFPESSISEDVKKISDSHYRSKYSITVFKNIPELNKLVISKEELETLNKDCENTATYMNYIISILDVAAKFYFEI
jgi:hypothetical protein